MPCTPAPIPNRARAQVGIAMPLLETVENAALRAGVPVDGRIEQGRTPAHALGRLWEVEESTVSSHRPPLMSTAASRPKTSPGSWGMRPQKPSCSVRPDQRICRFAGPGRGAYQSAAERAQSRRLSAVRRGDACSHKSRATGHGPVPVWRSSGRPALSTPQWVSGERGAEVLGAARETSAHARQACCQPSGSFCTLCSRA